MSKEKLYGLRDQLSKFLYDPTPDQAAWRDKMWEEGRFDESIKITKQVETQLEEVETQIEAFEAAEPELGEKIVANTLLNLPLGKQLKGTGLGSLLGLAEEELGAAETQRLKDIEQEIYELNAIRQRDLEGGKVTSGTISGIDADIRALENEGTELKQLLSTPLSEEPEDRKMQLFEEFIKDKTDLTFAEEEFLKAYPEFGSPSLRQLTPEQILEELGAQEGTVFDEELLKNAEGLAKGMGISTEDLQKALQQGEKEGLMSLIGKTPTTGDEALEAEKETFHNKYFNKRPPPPGKFEKSAVKAKKGSIPGETSQLYRSSWIKTEYEPNEFDEDGPRRKFYEIIDLFDLRAGGLEGITREPDWGDQWDRLKDARAVAKLREDRALVRIEKAARDGNTDYIEEIRAEIVDFRGTWAESLFQINFEEKSDIGSGREGLAEDLIDLANRAEHLLDEAVKRGEASIKGYQGGGLVMNYGDYGRSYT